MTGFCMFLWLPTWISFPIGPNSCVVGASKYFPTVQRLPRCLHAFMPQFWFASRFWLCIVYALIMTGQKMKPFSPHKYGKTSPVSVQSVFVGEGDITVQQRCLNLHVDSTPQISQIFSVEKFPELGFILPQTTFCQNRNESWLSSKLVDFCVSSRTVIKTHTLQNKMFV